MPRMYCDAHWIAHLQQEEDWLDRYGPVPWAWDKTLNDEVFHPDAVPHRARKASRAGMVVALLAVAAALLVGGILIVSAMAENPLVH